jgi:tetratricopeptide (TPR) repeat protein
MASLYREFATWTLHDLAIRKRQGDRIIFQGNHVSAQYLLPVRHPDEAPEQFAERKRKFWKELPRHSDLSERLALAFKALCLIEEQKAAAYDIVEILRNAPADKRAYYASRGIGYAYRPIDSAFRTTRRGHRTKRKKRGICVEARQAETIRVQASEFIRNHKNFDARFRDRLEWFTSSLWRKTQWYEQTEKSYLARVAAFEERSGPFEWWSAMILPALAYLYHEQRKFAQALVHYRKAIGAARRALMHEDLRSFVVYWMRLGIKLCLRSASVIEMPPYDGPWLPSDLDSPVIAHQRCLVRCASRP